jgi:hypothetical protein
MWVLEGKSVNFLMNDVMAYFSDWWWHSPICTADWVLLFWLFLLLFIQVTVSHIVAFKQIGELFYLPDIHLNDFQWIVL